MEFSENTIVFGALAALFAVAFFVERFKHLFSRGGGSEWDSASDSGGSASDSSDGGGGGDGGD